MDGIMGSTSLFAGNFAPRNWAFCSGQLIPISQNTALFSILGTQFGGNGTTTFALPDLRGRAVIGTGSGPGLSPYDLGEMGGAESVVMTATEMPAHIHPVNGTMTPSCGATPNSATPDKSVYGTSATLLYNYAGGTFMAPFIGQLTTSSAGNNLPFACLQPVMAINYVICTAGIFPVRP